MEQALRGLNLGVPHIDGTYKEIELSEGSPVFILGQNGVGKSALVHHFFQQMRGQFPPGKLIYLPGSRSSTLSSENLSLTPAATRTFEQNVLSWDHHPSVRWIPNQPTTRNEKAIFNLESADRQYRIDATHDIEINGSSARSISTLMERNGPVDRVNRLLEQSGLLIRLRSVSNELRVVYDDHNYSIAKLSDGERSIVIMLADVISSPEQSCFIIDEPELHIHRGIIVSVIAACIAERPDCRFLISTHELALPRGVPASGVLIVRGCRWRKDECVGWDFDFLSRHEDIDDDIERAIFGARRKILFVEGTERSLDFSIYSILFPGVTVVPRENCRSVVAAVRALRAAPQFHFCDPMGIIDGDYLSPEEMVSFKAEKIFVIPNYSVESLFFGAEVRASVAARQAETLGIEPKEILADAEALALDRLRQEDVQRHLAARLAEMRIRRDILLRLPSRDEIVKGATGPYQIQIEPRYEEEKTQLSMQIELKDLDSIIARYPVRESGILDKIAKGLRFASRLDYQRAVLARIEADAVLARRLRAQFDPLAPSLS